MTRDEFQKRYHDYAVPTEMEAISDSLKVNAVLKDDECVPVKIGGQYCLMLKSAAEIVQDLF